MAAVGRVRDFFFFFLVLFPPPVSSPPLFAALAARAVGLGGGMGADGSNGGGDRTTAMERRIDRSIGCNNNGGSIDPEMSFVVTGGCASDLFENGRH